ncbi:Leucine aminopeptidase 1 [Orchesella cincta]|uniref:Leucine aminopeptidase 1 n=1 Tax=Orchesella cincta TaxID=48709 RepID=A0A1D2MKF2_ORCCI|nr:Leucine aminopeptidase 1 [Orchesella cincta]
MDIKLLLIISLVLASTLSQERPEGKRLIKSKLNESAQWMDDEEINKFIRNAWNPGFIDLTVEGEDTFHPDDLEEGIHLKSESYPTSPLHQSSVLSLFPFLEADRELIKAFVRKFASYHSRNSREYYGEMEAEGWLSFMLTSTLSGFKGGYSISQIGDSTLGTSMKVWPYKQKNIIVKLEGQDPTLKSELIILGAHYDTQNKKDELFYIKEKAPGADDNAAACGILVEVLKLVTESGMELKRGVEFHFYAAKESGLEGSQDVVRKYKEKKKKVKAVLTLDMIGYRRTFPSSIPIGVVGGDKEVTPGLTAFVKILKEEYLLKENEMKEVDCSVGCFSDNYSWHRAGYPVAFLRAFEKKYDGHSQMDFIQGVYGRENQDLNFDQVHEYAKLALAFVIELGEPCDGCSSLGVNFNPGWLQVTSSFIGMYYIMSYLLL